MQRWKKAAHCLVIASFLSGMIEAQTAPKPDPERALWNAIREQLTGPDADTYFSQSMKDAQLPALTGTLIRHEVQAPNLLSLAMTDSAVPEVTILLRKDAVQFAPRLQQGAKIQFEGVAQSFQKNPFNVLFEVDDAQEPIAALGALASDWYLGPDAGRLQNGRFAALGVQFELPAGWSVRATRPATVGGDVAVLQNSQFQGLTAAVWICRQNINSSEISDQLAKMPAEIVAQRPDLSHYAIRAGSLQSTWIGGKQAMQAVADYASGEQKMSEALTWIVTENARVVFFARTTTDQLPDLQSWFDRLVYTAFIP
jgi:hypothetical protein